MSEFWAEFFSRQSVSGFGLSLSLVGVVLWVLPRRFKQTFEMRRRHADRLRAAGEDARARKVEVETERLATRLPFYGRLFAMTGALVLLLVWLRAR